MLSKSNAKLTPTLDVSATKATKKPFSVKEFLATKMFFLIALVGALSFGT